MSKFSLTIKAYREEPTNNPYWHDDRTKAVYVTEAELFEAISKYLQVKGFKTEQLSVTKEENDG